jgi:N-acyl-D-aspartate/D-glutamate deacylase
VTTVVGGNCGFSIAPLTDGGGDYLMRMLARVEGMPLESLQSGVPWDWTSTADYLDRLEGALVPNAGFLVGHSAIRRAVMRDEAVGGRASPAQVEEMRQVLGAGLAAGGLGFSSSWSRTHNDHEGNPVPSRHASREELLALCSVVAAHEGTTLEFIPGTLPFGDDLVDVMAAMSVAANRPLNWNVLTVYANNAGLVDGALAASDAASVAGGRVAALTLPDTLRTRLNFRTGFILDALPGWEASMVLPDDEKLALLADAAGRAELDALAQSETGALRSVANWKNYLILETASPATREFEGMSVGEAAGRLDRSPWDALCEIVVADRLRTIISYPDRGQDDVSWSRRVEVWRDPRTVVGASDAGAHLDMIDSFSYATTLIARAVRERGLLPIEEAVRLLTGEPAELYGLTGRGAIAVGAHADLVVFDPAAIGPGPVSTRFDLPGGAGRVYGAAEGIEHVFVAGVEVVSGSAFTGETPGRVLRSGTDTATVPAAGVQAV